MPTSHKAEDASTPRYLTGKIPANKVALRHVVLGWSPDQLRGGEWYSSALRDLPSLPVLNQDQDQYMDAFKPALVAELLTRIQQAIAVPNERSRLLTQRIVTIAGGKSKENRRYTITVPLMDRVRPMDMVFLSNSGNPLRFNRGSWIISAIVNGVNDSGRISLETSIACLPMLLQFLGNGTLCVTTLTSLASQFRVMDALGLDEAIVPSIERFLLTKAKAPQRPRNCAEESETIAILDEVIE